MAQIISSRHPFPTRVFETPSTHLAWAWSGFAEAVTAPTTDTATTARIATGHRIPN